MKRLALITGISGMIISIFAPEFGKWTMTLAALLVAVSLLPEDEEDA